MNTALALGIASGIAAVVLYLLAGVWGHAELLGQGAAGLSVALVVAGLIVMTSKPRQG